MLLVPNTVLLLCYRYTRQIANIVIIKEKEQNIKYINDRSNFKNFNAKSRVR